MPATLPSGAEYIAVKYRSSTGALVESSLDRVSVDEVVACQPVREFRWYKGRKHYSGWYWSSTTGGLLAYAEGGVGAESNTVFAPPVLTTSAAHCTPPDAPSAGRRPRRAPEEPSAGFCRHFPGDAARSPARNVAAPHKV